MNHPEDKERIERDHGDFTDRVGDAAIALQDAAYKLGRERGQAEGKAKRDELLSALDQLANGRHLDDVPNHSDDDLRTIAARLPESEAWARKALLAHADRVDAAIAKHGCAA